jgi:hypothetical protein
MFGSDRASYTLRLSAESVKLPIAAHNVQNAAHHHRHATPQEFET